MKKITGTNLSVLMYAVQNSHLVNETGMIVVNGFETVSSIKITFIHDLRWYLPPQNMRE